MNFATPAGRAFWAFINCTSPITWAGLDVSWNRLIELRVEALLASPRPPDGILFWCPGPEFGGWRPTVPVYDYDDELELLTGENFEIDNILRAQELQANPVRDVNGNITGPGQPYPAIATTIHQVADYWATLANPPRKAFYLGMLQGRVMEAIMAKSVETAIDRVRRSIELVKLAEPDAIIIDASSSAIGRNNELTRFVAGHPLFDYLIQLAKDPNEPRIVFEAIPGYQLERETRGQPYMAAWADFASVHPTINPLRVGKSADLTTTRGICYWLDGAMNGSDPWNQTNISAIDALGVVEHAFEDWDQIAGDLPPRANPAPLGFLAEVTGAERNKPLGYDARPYSVLTRQAKLAWRALGDGDLLDSSGNGRHASASGAVTFAAAPAGSTAPGKVFQTGPSAKLAGDHGQTALPLALSLRWQVTTPAADLAIAAFETSGGGNPFYRLIAKPSGQIEMTRYSPTQTFAWGNFQVPNAEVPADGEWVHLLWVLEPKAARLYLDGKLVAWDGTPAVGQTINTPHLGAPSPDLHAPSLSPRLVIGEAGHVQDVQLFGESLFEETARVLSSPQSSRVRIMANQVAYHLGATGQTLYAYPATQSLANWTTHRVALTEAASPNTGRYSGTLDDSKGSLWGVFVGSSQPANWAAAIEQIQLPIARVAAPFLDTQVASDFVLALTDRSANTLVDRVIEVLPGERYVVAIDCSAIMAPGQQTLYSFDLPTSSGVTIVPTSDLANPQHGVAGRLAKFQFEVPSGATSGQSLTINLVIQPNEYTRVKPTVTARVI